MADMTAGQIFGSGLSGLISALGLSQNLGNIKDDRARMEGQLFGAGGGDQAWGSGGLKGYLEGSSNFVPATVRSGLGNTSFNADNNQTQYNLSLGQQAQSDQLYQGATDFYNRASADPTTRTNEIYDSITAAQRPEMRRQYDSMNSGLFGSGRGGMMSGAFGGSPEQFAFEKARAEADNQAYLSAMGQQQQEMMNYGNMGQMFQTNQFMPYQQLGQQMGQGLQQSQLQNQTMQNQAGLMSQLGLGGMTTDVNWSNIYGNLMGEIAKAAGAGVGGIGGSIFDALS